MVLTRMNNIKWNNLNALLYPFNDIHCREINTLLYNDVLVSSTFHLPLLHNYIIVINRAMTLEYNCSSIEKGKYY